MINARFGFIEQRRLSAIVTPPERNSDIVLEKVLQPSKLIEDEKGSTLSSADVSVLRVFATYLMTPGKMLCFNIQEQILYEQPLTHLTRLRMISPEQMKGAYSLTQLGYTAMRDEK